MEKLSPPVRIFALVAALAGVGALLFLFTVGRGSGQEPLPVAPAAPAKAAEAVAPRVEKSAAPAAKSAAPAAAPTAKAPPARKPAAAPKPAPSGFPSAVDAALREHEVVVVSLVVPGARVDELAAAEARAGAAAGGVGYLALNVLNEKVARALLTKLDGLQDPGLLVIRRPGEIALELNGFVDRETVAQAAANATS